MKTTIKKSILSAAFIVAICSVCLPVSATLTLKSGNTIAFSDTGKMSKPMKKKKMSKMSKDKMKKDTSKMSKM